tara:strand:+ start:215 stop:577 length:363 start_codon:yes stop_codon:yes gene_type:complete
MGYRSEVAFAIAPGPLVDKFLAVMAANEKVRDMIKYDEKYKEGIEFSRYDEGDIFVYLGSVKWYESYEEVSEIIKFFNEHEEEDCDDIRFVRSGEDPEDTEFMGHYQEDTIYIPSPGIVF